MEAAATPADRAALFAASKCSAIDDEWNSVVCLAQARGIPFAVLRAVSDDADASLPMAARHATNPDGRAHIQSVLEALRAEPSQFFDLHKTAFEFVRAIGRLYDAYRVIGPDFCFQ